MVMPVYVLDNFLVFMVNLLGLLRYAMNWLLWKPLTATKKKIKTRSSILRSNPLRYLQNHSLSTYLALRRQKVKVGALKPAFEDDLVFFVGIPDVIEEQVD